MIRPLTSSRFAAALLALWLCAQLLSAFHIGHDDQVENLAPQDSCLLCKVAHADDLILFSAVAMSLVALCVATLGLLLPSSPVRLVLAPQARGPPAI